METIEYKALGEMKKMLSNYGLQIVLQSLIDSLDELVSYKEDSKALPSKMILEVLKGVHKAYLFRNWGEY